MRYTERNFNNLSKSQQKRLRDQLMSLGQHCMISLGEISLNKLEYDKISKYGRVKLRFSTLVRDLQKIKNHICPHTPKIIFIKAGLRMTLEKYTLLEDAFSTTEASYYCYCHFNDEIEIRWVYFR